MRWRCASCPAMSVNCASVRAVLISCAMAVRTSRAVFGSAGAFTGLVRSGTAPSGEPGTPDCGYGGMLGICARAVPPEIELTSTASTPRRNEVVIVSSLREMPKAEQSLSLHVFANRREPRYGNAMVNSAADEPPAKDYWRVDT